MTSRGDGLTYPEVGATREKVLPAGYQHVRREAVVGRGRAAFEAAAAGIVEWRMHRGAGLAVVRAPDRAAAGEVVVLRIGVRIPCRVVYVVEERDRRGFAYGTLDGHPVRGEEAFVVELTPEDEVRLVITAFSRPATLPARVGAPVTRIVQRLVTDRYVRAVRALARG